MRRLAAVFCFLIALSGLPAGAVEFDTTSWYQGADGFEQAAQLAKESGKPLFVYFRTDWCPYCKQFERELLSSDQVRRFFEEIVAVTINPELGPDENRIAAAYSVRGFPAIFVHPVEGRPRQVRRTVMRDGGVGLQTPDEFVATLTLATGK